MLLEMTARHSAQYRTQYVGSVIGTLIEEKKNGYYLGHTADYVKTKIISSARILSEGEIISGVADMIADEMILIKDTE